MIKVSRYIGERDDVLGKRDFAMYLRSTSPQRRESLRSLLDILEETFPRISTAQEAIEKFK